MTTVTSSRTSTPREPLPRARRERWQPLRGGLVDIFKYEDQEFRYEDGRLILRGNNGTGKSRVLALQFPFLLDGEVGPHRLEPDGDVAKRVEWNLLMGRYPERTGYSWAELGRRDPDGTEHYLTIGCGLRAVDGRGIADRWFFVTPRRLGRDLSLLTSERVVLSRDRLDEALGGEGRIFRDAKTYRKAVNEALFGLDPRRYQALVDLLVQLRKPQLSRSLDERGLSAALSEALSPVSAEIIGPVAEAFRGMEQERLDLERYTAADRSVRAFMREYRRYAAIASRRAAATVRRAHSQYEARTRELRAAGEALAAAATRLDEANVAVERLDRELGVARAELATLESSPEKKNADDLDAARQRADEFAKAANAAEERRARAAGDESRAAGELADAVAAERAARGEVQHEIGTARREADCAGLGSLHANVVEPLALPDGSSATEALGAAQAKLARAVESRRNGLRVLKDLQASVRAREAEVANAREFLDAAQAELAEAVEREAEACDEHAQRGAALVIAFRAWCGGLRELSIGDVDVVRGALDRWCAEPDGRSPIDVAASKAHDAAKRGLYEERARRTRRSEELSAELDELRARHDELVAGRHLPPPSSPARDTASRAARQGAPLWMLCDFQPEVEPPARAGIEAALEAAGLLDAWLTPDGGLFAEGVHDAVLVAGRSPLPAERRDVGAWLVPSIDRASRAFADISEETVAAVLSHIGAGPEAGYVWISQEGRFQVGPLHGAWKKPEAEHIGHAAREAAKRRRLHELAAEIERAERELALVHEEISALAEREERLDRERQAAPDGDAVLDARRRVAAAEADRIRREDKVAQQRAREQAKRSELVAALAKRDGVARDLGVADPAADLDPLVEALGEYARALGGLLNAAKAHARATHQEVSARDRHETAIERAERAREDAREASERARSAVAVRDTLAATIGAAVEEILRRLERARRWVEGLAGDHRGLLREQQNAAVAKGVAEKQIVTATEAQAAAAELRKASTDDFAHFVATGLGATAADALADVEAEEWSPTRAYDVARRFESELDSMPFDDGAWERSEKGIHRHIEELKRMLGPQDHEITVTVERGLSIVTAFFGGKECAMRAFERTLEQEVESRKALLTAREREVIENHLSAEVALHLHKLLRDAEQWVLQVNAELDERPTSTGMRLRFAWEPLDDEVSGLAEARRRLLRTEGTWTPAERKALGEFLQQRIELERQRREMATWQEHLTAALDYRKWHRFIVLRYQDKTWKPLTKRTHGTGSGGEKAIALTIPQFAAAAAHYKSAAPTAPRLILLDEAFVGIDKRMRSHCMGLLHAFDLDFVMTSESEWGCYPTVPALAICQLATRPEVDAVGVTRWIWNGRERVRDVVEV